MLKRKEIKCKKCNKFCYTGKRSLCDKCYGLELKAKEKLKAKKEKIKIKKDKDTFNSISLTKVYPLIQKVARLVGVDYCVSCGNKNPTDGGHFFPKKGCGSIGLFILNINPQCRYCNSYLEGNQYSHAQWIIKNKGQHIVEWLQKASKITYKFSKPELHEIKNLCLEVITRVESGENKELLYEYTLESQKQMEFYKVLNNQINGNSKIS